MQLLQARGNSTIRRFQWITPWVLVRIKESDWKELLETVILLYSLDTLNAQELISNRPEMLRDDFGTPDLESLDHQ